MAITGHRERDRGFDSAYSTGESYKVDHPDRSRRPSRKPIASRKLGARCACRRSPPFACL